MPAETSTAETLRDRTTDRDEVPYYLQRPGFADIAAAAPPDLAARIAANEREMLATRESQKAARETERLALEKRATETKAQIAPVEQAMGRREQLAAQRPAPLVLPPAPSRKLTDFLSPVAGEQPENTISKLLQGVGLLATGFTGLARKDARSALAAMSGALKGWHDGDKERADRAFQDWQAASGKMLKEHQDRVQSYRDIMEDATLTINQRMDLLKLKAVAEGHDLAVATFDRKNADEDLAFLTSYRNHLDSVEHQAAILRQGYDLRIMQLQMQADARQQAHEHFLEGVAQRERFHYDQMALGRERLAATKEKKEELKPTPVSEMKRIEDVVIGRAYIGEMQDLAGKVDLNKIVGGVRPWINQLIQRWGQPNSPQPPEGTKAGQIPTGRFAMSPDELRFLALMQDYADTILRQRSGAAISIQEFNRMLQFVPDQSVTPDTLRERMKLAEDISRTKEEIQRQALESGGYRFPKIHVPKFIRGEEPKAPEGRMPAPPGRAANDPLGIRR